MAFKLVTPVETLLLNLNLCRTPVKLKVTFSLEIKKTFVSKIKNLHALIKRKFYYSSFIPKIYPIPITHKDLEGNKKNAVKSYQNYIHQFHYKENVFAKSLTGVLKPQDSMEHGLNGMDLKILFQHLPTGTEEMYKILQ